MTSLPDSPAATLDGVPAETDDEATHVAVVDEDSDQPHVLVMLETAIAGLGERNDPVLVPADRARDLTEVGHATYIDSGEAEDLGLDDEAQAAVPDDSWVKADLITYADSIGAEYPTRPTNQQLLDAIAAAQNDGDEQPPART